MIMGSEGPKSVTVQELCGTGTSVLFAVPGAFTPTCSAQHLPGFIERAADFKGKGVDRLICMAVNDVFVMDAWARQSGASSMIVMAADGNGAFSEALGLSMDASAFGMGRRAQRFAMIVKDGVVTGLFVEAPGEFRASSAENVIDHL